MRVRTSIINMITFGTVCGLCGYHLNDWHFWLILVGMLVIQVNNSIPED